MTFLTLLSLDPSSREVQRDLADCQQLHRTVMSGFAEDTRDRARAVHTVLHRLDSHPLSSPQLLVQSGTEPDWSLDNGYLLAPPDTKPIDAALTSLVAGQRLGFRLRANPTRSVPAEPRDAQGARSRGERRPIRDEDGQRVWLQRLGERHGFNLPLDGGGHPVVGVAAEPPLVGWRDKHRLTITACTFDGTLEVADAQRFLSAVRAGVGRARAYGCGLLSLRPA